jgi:hypothetical protein
MRSGALAAGRAAARTRCSGWRAAAFFTTTEVEEAEALVLAKPLIPASRTQQVMAKVSVGGYQDRARESRRKLSLQGREHEVLARANDFEVRVGV